MGPTSFYLNPLGLSSADMRPKIGENRPMASNAIHPKNTNLIEPAVEGMLPKMAPNAIHPKDTNP